jgi:gliding motility-associated protein GldE
MSDSILLNIGLIPLQINITLYSLGVLLLLAASAAVSSSEVALFSFTPEQRKKIEEAENGSLYKIKVLTSSPNKESATRQILATILIVNNAVNIAIVILSTALMETWFPPEDYSPLTALIIHVVLVTFIIVMFGEVIPKIYATSNNLKVAGAMSGPLSVIQIFVRPLSWILISAGNFIDKKIKNKIETISVDQLGHALALTQNEMRSVEERRILEGIVTFGEKNVSQIMTPRTDLAMLSCQLSMTQIIAAIKEKGYSRWPVFDEQIDNIKGILHVKDLLPHLIDENFDWKSLIKSGMFVPETKKIDDLLMEFRHDRKHLALVVDEYGGLSGIVTLEDVIEEIVGDIQDEFDVDDLKYSVIDDNTYLFEGKISLVDFYRVFRADETLFESHKGDSSTLAGFIMEILGRVPQKGEKHQFHQYLFTIDAATHRKLDRIKVHKQS